MYKNIGSNNSRGGPYGAHRPLAPASSLQSLIARPSDYSFFSSNQFLDRLSRPSGLRDSVIQSTPLLQRFAKESDQKQTNQQQSQLSQPFSAASTSQFQNDRLSVRASSLGVFLNAPPVAPLNQDPRELTSPEWQRHAMARLLEVLAATDFDWQNPKHVFSISHLLPISKHTLEKVFEHFMRTLLFEYSLEKLRFEDEVAKWARQLGYPYHHMLKKNTLNSPNIPSSGAVVCGFLDWMRETMEIWMSLVNKESKFGTIFKFNISDMEEDPSNESCFHKFRMEFMVAAYLRSCNGRSDVEDLVERFVQQLNERYGDLKTTTEALQAEINERKGALTERVRNYETLEALNTKYNDRMQKRAQKSVSTGENQKSTAHAEREIVAGQEKLRAKEAQAVNLRAEIAELKKLVRQQPLKRNQLNDFKRDIENEQSAAANKQGKLKIAQHLVNEESRKKAALLSQIQELTSSLQEGLAALSGMVTLEAVSIPDYGNDVEIVDHVSSIRAALDQAGDAYRKQSGEMGDFIKQQDTRFRELSAEKEEKKMKADRIKAQITELQSASTSVHLEQQKPNDTSALLEKERLTQDLAKREANLAELKTVLKEAQHTRSSNETTVQNLQTRLARHELASARKVEQFRQKQEERIGILEKVAERITKVDQNMKRVVKKYIHEMAEAANKCKEGLRGSKE